MKIQPLPLDNCFRRCCSCEAYNRVGKYLFSPFRSYHREGKDDHSSNTEDVQVMAVGQVILLFTRSHKTTSLHFGRAMQELYFSLSYECYKIANICNKIVDQKKLIQQDLRQRCLLLKANHHRQNGQKNIKNM